MGAVERGASAPEAGHCCGAARRAKGFFQAYQGLAGTGAKYGPLQPRRGVFLRSRSRPKALTWVVLPIDFGRERIQTLR